MTGAERGERLRTHRRPACPSSRSASSAAPSAPRSSRTSTRGDAAGRKAEDLAATADVLPTLLADAEPPAGFEARTLERLRIDQARVPRWSLSRRVLTVAAIVAAAMIVTLATVRILDAGSSSPSASGSTEVKSAPMVGASGPRPATSS